MKVKLSFILFLGLSNLLLSQNVNLDSLFEPKLKGELFEVKAGFVGNEFNRCYCHIEIKDNDEPFMLTILNKKGFNSFCYINNIKIKFIGC